MTLDPMPIKALNEEIVNIGLLSSDELKAVHGNDASAGDCRVYADTLVQSGSLTSYQMQQLLEGKGQTLCLGDYLILEPIAAGGMGNVFRARHRIKRTLFAIKTMPDQRLPSSAARKRFQREISVARKLKHPNIATVYEGSADGEVPWYAMECIQGADLQRHVNQHGPFSMSEAVDIICQTARALEYVHDQEIIHRDIKPANLMLSEDNQVMLVDLGLARVDDQGAANSGSMLTQTGAAMGSVEYMAPEQAHDAAAIDRRADLYSLGCVWHFLVHGKAPFQGATEVETLLAHSERPIPRLSRHRDRRSRALNRVFQKLLAKQPDDRCQSAAELVAAIESARATRGPSTAVLGTSIVALLILVVWAGLQFGGLGAAAPVFTEDLGRFELLFALDHQLTTLDLGAGETRPLVDAGFNGTQPDWSPDGSRIVCRRGNVGEIFVVNADGTDARQITSNSTWEHTPKWSPDGSRILFVGAMHPTPAPGAGKNPTDIWVMNEDCSNLLNLTDDQRQDWHPAWLPNGVQVALCVSGGLQIMAADGTEEELLKFSRSPNIISWNPRQDDLLAMQATAPDGSQQLFLVTIRSKSERQITLGGDLNGYPCWSPDGRYLAYVHVEDAPVWYEGGAGELRIYDTETAQNYTLLAGDFEAENAWVSWRLKPK